MGVKVIAEVAQGYEGKPEYCDYYVRAAAKAGATAVKFQIVYADDVAVPGYQYYEFFKQLEMDISVWKAIKERCLETGIQLIADVSGKRAMTIAEELKPDGIKIHSTDFFNRELIHRAFNLSKLVFISTGGVSLDEIDALMDDLDAWGVREQLVLLYGFQAEPTPIDKSNLGRLPQLKQRYPDVPLGYMDHVAGDRQEKFGVSLMAMMLGAEWFEKHITISRFMEVEDYVSALEPDEFADYVISLNELSAALGESDTTLTEEEEAYRDKAVKKLVAVRELPAGQKLSCADLDFKRTPLIPSYEGFHDPKLVIGRALIHPVKVGDPILEENLK